MMIVVITVYSVTSTSFGTVALKKCQTPDKAAKYAQVLIQALEALVQNAGCSVQTATHL